MSSKISFRLAVPDETGEFTESFTIDDVNGIRSFFETHGFVVVREALSEEECQASKSAIFDLIEEATGGAFDRSRIETWNNWPPESLEQYGSPQIAPVFRAQLLRNRQNAKVYRLFSLLIGNEDLLVNHDRCCLFRPTEVNQAWKTRGNVHLDMNPWRWSSTNEEDRTQLESLTYDRVSNFIFENNQPTVLDGVQLQGVINFHDNTVMDGGFVTVPGFHREFDEYFAQLPPNEQTSYNFKESSAPFKRAERVAMRAGSIVVWDQRMAHGSFPNKSTVPRFGQFIKMFPRGTVSRNRLRYRAAAVERNILPVLLGPGEEENRKSKFTLNDTGKIVFSVDLWETRASHVPQNCVELNCDEDEDYNNALADAL